MNVCTVEKENLLSLFKEAIDFFLLQLNSVCYDKKKQT